MAAEILIVDDDRAVADTIAAALESEGYAVRCAFDGHEAVAEVIRAAPDLVLTGEFHPGLRGHELARWLRELATPIPGILMSAWHASAPIPPDVPFLAKPFLIEDLLSAIVTLLFADGG